MTKAQRAWVRGDIQRLKQILSIIENAERRASIEQTIASHKAALKGARPCTS